MGLLDGEIAELVHNAVSPLLLPFQIERTPAGTYDPATQQVTAGTPVVYDAKGVVDSYSAFDRAQASVEQNDRKILLITKSITLNGAAVTVALDTGDVVITPEGERYRVVNVDRDPAGATFTVQGRR